MRGRATGLPWSTLENSVELAGHPDGLVVAEGLLPAGDVVVDHLGDGGVVADDDEDGGGLAVLLRVGVLPRGERLRVGVVERVERAFEQAGHLVRGDRALLAALLRQAVLDTGPEVEEAHVGRGRVVVDGDAGDLHDAGLDRLDQAEVGDHPGEQRALPVAGAGQEGRGGGQVVDTALTAEPLVDRTQAVEPEAGRLGVLLGLGLVVAGEVLVGDALILGVVVPVEVAVVRLVVEDHDPRGAAEVAADPGNHLAPGLEERARRAGRARQQLLGERADRLALLGLPALELVVVRDDDLRLAEVVVQVGGDEAAELVVVLLVLGEQDTEPVPDRQAGGNDEEPLGEARVVRLRDLVERLPGDEHRHHDGLARAGRHLQRDPVQAEVARGVRLVELVADPGVAVLLRRLGEVDRGLGGLPLGEQDRVVALRVGPVLEQAARGGRDVRVALLAPDINAVPDLVDEVVLPDLVRGELGEVELNLLAALARPGDRNEVLAWPAPRRRSRW